MRCGHCGLEKSSDEFNLQRKVTRGRQYNCRECARTIARERLRAWRQAVDPEELIRYNRNAALKRLYGITLEEYTVLLEAQGGVCAICAEAPGTRAGPGRRRHLAVDHDHSTGKIRGLLCHHCNVAIGYMRDDPALFDNAKAYVLKFRTEIT